MFCVLYKAGWTTGRIWTDIGLAMDEVSDDYVENRSESQWQSLGSDEI
jgi:hypothetical protein